jgi:hypothetical protein
LRDWKSPNPQSPQEAQPNEQPQECPTDVRASTRNGP